MKRISLLTITGLLLFLFSASGASAFGTKDVLKMNEDGIADSLIVLKIENSGRAMDVLERKLLNQLVNRQYLLAFRRRPSQQRQEIAKGRRHKTTIAVSG